ncbi:hypothetical protein FM111_00970 [Brevundimonas diminuta 3F5N]|uniref:Helix-turn-helix domain-containing protein n=1 Tax=Brevundimonas diminuta 3F5N TaxID=1255603 RepID=A0A1R4EVB5_BREDI|nr:helix-turn-helix domain-containing protein [Brevundimonas diminuta]SJM47519.1 hypothetical protein FM111_00970 [Brevundimonas diminuta 3F5N]
MPRADFPVALNMRNAVAYSGLSRSRLYEMMRSGDLPSLRVGGRRMIQRAAIDTFFAKLAQGEG